MSRIPDGTANDHPARHLPRRQPASPGAARVRAGWVAADCRGRHYELTIGDVEDTKMTARIRHGDGDRRQLAYADLAPFVEAQFDQLDERLERPVFACCDGPSPTRPDLPSLRG